MQSPLNIHIQPDATAASVMAARIIETRVREKPDAVLGLATGGTPVGLYKELIRLHQDEGLDFSRVTTFNLDEYLGLGPEHPASYHTFMFEQLFDHLNVPEDNIHIPDGLASDTDRHCLQYEDAIRMAGGIDIQVLGIGGNGHIGFNEPDSPHASRTHVTRLTAQTRKDNAIFFQDGKDVPLQAITMGIGTILECRECLLLAFGEHKASAVAAMLNGPITTEVPASALRLHPNVHVFMDEPAACDYGASSTAMR